MQIINKLLVLLINVRRLENYRVGPRPCLRWEAEMFPAEFASRFTVRAGAHRAVAGQRAQHARHPGHAAAGRALRADPNPVDGPGHPVRTVPVLLRRDGAR